MVVWLLQDEVEIILGHDTQRDSSIHDMRGKYLQGTLSLRPSTIHRSKRSCSLVIRKTDLTETSQCSRCIRWMMIFYLRGQRISGLFQRGNTRMLSMRNRIAWEPHNPPDSNGRPCESDCSNATFIYASPWTFSSFFYALLRRPNQLTDVIFRYGPRRRRS